MDTLTSMAVFKQVVESGSFTQAAERLEMSTAMTSRHVQHLEGYLSAKLLNRSSRKISLTSSGQAFYETCGEMLSLLSQAQADAQQVQRVPQGLLKITAPVWCATDDFVQMLAAYRLRYPKVQLSLNLDNHHSDLMDGESELALRVTKQLPEQWVARPITTIKFRWVASPDYLKRHMLKPQMQGELKGELKGEIAGQGIPKTRADLAMHDGIVPNYVAAEEGLVAVCDSNDTVMLAKMAQAGMGIAHLPNWLVDEQIAQGELQELFTDDESMQNERQLYAIYVDRKYLNAKVRSFIDFIVDWYEAK